MSYRIGEVHLEEEDDHIITYVFRPMVERAADVERRIADSVMGVSFLDYDYVLLQRD